MNAPSEPPSPPTEPKGRSPQPRGAGGGAPRSALGAGSRDIFISMLILLPIVGLVALLGRGCSFSPGGPTVDSSQLPTIDPHPTLVSTAAHLGFPLREPVLPGWRATVVNLDMAPGGQRAVRISWLTPDGRYLRLVQTTAEEGALVEAETGGAPGAARPVRAAGAQWVAYSGANHEQAWARRVDGVEWLITGDATPAEFTTVAEALDTASPLPRAGG